MFGAAGVFNALESVTASDGGGPNVSGGGDVGFTSGASVGGGRNSGNGGANWPLVAVAGLALVAVVLPLIRKGR